MMRDYRKSKGKNITKYPMEVKILKNIYHLELKNIDYKKLLHLVCLVSSFDIAVIVSVCSLFKEGYIQLIVTFLLVLPVIFSSYYIMASIYKFRNRRIRK